MITFEDALLIAVSQIKRFEKERDLHLSLRIIREETLEEDFGWVFFYNSNEYLGTGDMTYYLEDNSPLIIDRKDGTVHYTGMDHPIEFYIDEYKRKRIAVRQ